MIIRVRKTIWSMLIHYVSQLMRLLTHNSNHMRVSSINGSPNSWMVYFMEKSYENGWFVMEKPWKSYIQWMIYNGKSMKILLNGWFVTENPWKSYKKWMIYVGVPPVLHMLRSIWPFESHTTRPIACVRLPTQPAPQWLNLQVAGNPWLPNHLRLGSISCISR